MVYNISAGLTVVYNSSYTGIIKKEKNKRKKKRGMFLFQINHANSRLRMKPMTDN